MTAKERRGWNEEFAPGVKVKDGGVAAGGEDRCNGK